MLTSHDITLLAPYKSVLSILISVCEDYAAEYDIIFAGSKSKIVVLQRPILDYVAAIRGIGYW